MDLDSLDDLYAIGLDEIHAATRAYGGSLPSLAEAAKDEDLTHLIRDHLKKIADEERGVRALRQACKRDPEADDIQCAPMEEMLCDCKKFADNADVEPEIRDAGMLAGIQSIELWLISKLGSVRAFAEDLGLHEASDRLAEYVEAGGRFNRDLTRLAERHVNFKANDL